MKGAENIPLHGPLFIVANHPSAFMDPIVISTLVKRKCFFIAKGAAFQSRFAKWILPKFNVIPIYRADETPEEVHKNEQIFELCYHHFEQGGAIIIFPEGISVTERKIKKIKTGTARIALGAEARNNYSLNIKIVTIGLNFTNPHQFQSDLFLNIDTPIDVSKYYDANKNDPFKAAHLLTDEIRTRIEKTVVAIDDAETDKLVADIELIYKDHLKAVTPNEFSGMEKDFNVARAISESVHYYIKNEPKRVKLFKLNINRYLSKLEKLSLHDSRLEILSNKGLPMLELMMSYVYLILGFPFFVYGVVNNYLPFRTPFFAARIMTKRPEFYGSIFITLGTFTFIFFYSLQIWLVNYFFDNSILTLTYAILLPISGFFAFYYRRRFTNLRGDWMIFTIFSKKANLIADLIKMRHKIIMDLEKGREEFEKRKLSQNA